MGHRRTLIAVLTLFAAPVHSQQPVVAPPAAAASTADALRVRFGATFRHAGQGDEAAQLAAIQGGVSNLGIFAGLATSRLRDSQRIADTLTFAFPPGFNEVRAAGRPALRAPADGSVIAATNYEGDAIQLRIAFVQGNLVLDADTPQGGRHAEYVLSADGLSLTARYTVHSPRLAHSIVYVLNYRRV